MWTQWMHRVLDARHLEEWQAEEDLPGRHAPAGGRRARTLVCLAPAAILGIAAQRRSQPCEACVCD